VIRHVAVVVPAADEETLIARCLDSVRSACAELAATTGGRVTTDVVVVLDDCRDGTADIVAGYAGVQALVADLRCVGLVRAAGCAHATERAAARGLCAADVWLATTDADSVVPGDWLTAGLALADAHGADVVAGTVLPGPELAPPARDAWLAAHDQRDGHRHVHGANLGVRATSLHRLGGWAPLITGEDVDLVERAELAQMTVLRTGALAVRTSARLHSRVPLGFAGYLRALPGAAGPDTALVDADGPGAEVTGAA
jgi:hypothetical protein